MATVTLEFIGLFLFDKTFGGKKRVAVIDADRDNVYHHPHPHPLRRHEAFITVHPDPVDFNWPRVGPRFALTGQIWFSETGPVDTTRWTLPKIATGCSGFHLQPTFFDAPRPGATHAVIEILGGTFCTWKFPVTNGAFNTRVTFTTSSFSIRGSDSRYIDLQPNTDVTVEFMNTDRDMAEDLSDWFWYYNATENTCAALPDATGVIAHCPEPPGITPYTLGCSNSGWP